MKNLLYFGISGKMGSGKDTIGNILVSNLEASGFRVVKLSFATPIRSEIDELVSDYSNLQEKELEIKYNVEYDKIKRLIHYLEDSNIYERTESSRSAIQYWGTDVRRSQDKDYWVKKLAQLAVSYMSSGYSVYISDARFPNEVEAIMDFGGRVIRLKVGDEERLRRINRRDGIKPTERQLSHPSETMLDKYQFNIEVNAEKPIDEVANDAYERLIYDNWK